MCGLRGKAKVVYDSTSGNIPQNDIFERGHFCRQALEEVMH